ncbi:hypothetical protein JCM21900_005698 [Sporobolomyces salmonicolor]
MPPVFGGAPKCPTWGKSVSFAEQTLGLGGVAYHKLCLKCAACGKILEPRLLVDHDGEAYYKACHGKSFGTKGHGAGALPPLLFPSASAISPETYSSESRPDPESDPPKTSLQAGSCRRIRLSRLGAAHSTNRDRLGTCIFRSRTLLLCSVPFSRSYPSIANTSSPAKPSTPTCVLPSRSSGDLLTPSPSPASPLLSPRVSFPLLVFRLCNPESSTRYTRTRRNELDDGSSISSASCLSPLRLALLTASNQASSKVSPSQ